MARARKRHIQLTLDQARKPVGHGGWRPKAGRPTKSGAVSHKTRQRFRQDFPQHVTLRIKAGEESIAKHYLMDNVIRPAIRASARDWFRVVEFNVLSNHIHLICEADGALTLARGVQGLAIRLARRLNKALKRKHKLFAHRYHAKSLTSPRQVRNALRYVLQNRKHHAAEKRFGKGWLDPFSSAPWFGGWSGKVWPNVGDEPRPTGAATTWLLARGWLDRGGGPLHVDERPG